MSKIALCLLKGFWYFIWICNSFWNHKYDLFICTQISCYRSNSVPSPISENLLINISQTPGGRENVRCSETIRERERWESRCVCFTNSKLRKIKKCCRTLTLVPFPLSLFTLELVPRSVCLYIIPYVLNYHNSFSCKIALLSFHVKGYALLVFILASLMMGEPLAGLGFCLIEHKRYNFRHFGR